MTNDDEETSIDGNPIEKVEDFVFVGSVVPSVTKYVERRTNVGSWAFCRLRNNIWTNQDNSRALKVRVYNALIRPIAIYGSETWTLRKTDRDKLETFEIRCLWTIAGVHLLDEIRSVDIRK
eukprot:XP_011683870.1 PREDICTED: uncharacterized protein LOC105447478 [Strongylocentrotus purpuratus]